MTDEYFMMLALKEARLAYEEDEIPIGARLFAIVDVWDALNSDRPYRSAWKKEEVFAFIQEQAGKHFDPKVVDVFFRVIK